MKFTCIIAEFNPLTFGHIKIINEAKKLGNPIICIMSGNFVQRGEPAIVDKFTRAKMSIENGVDIVIELPTIYALSSARDFAFGAIKTLNEIGCVENLIFGSECGNLTTLNNLREKINSEECSKIIKDNLKNGLSYSTAVASALDSPIKSNDILAIEYLNALDVTHSKITPITILREDNFNNTTPCADCSASAVREFIKKGNLKDTQNIFPQLKNLTEKDITNFETFEKLVEYKIKTSSEEELKNINGVNEGIENFIQQSFFEGKKNLNTKRYPKTKINRILCNAILNIDSNFVKTAKENDSTYFSILAINSSAKNLLAFFPKLKLITSKKDTEKLNELQLEIFNKDILASKIFSCINENYLGNEDFTKKL